MEELSKARAELDRFVKDAKADRGKAATLHKEAEALHDEVSRLKTEAEADRKTISEYQAEGTEKVAAIRETAANAGKLKTAIEGYQPQFDQFQAQLDTRNKTFTEGKNEQDRLLKKLGEIETDIETLRNHAEGMLQGATVAGLASSFGETRDKLTKELKIARRMFYLSIAIMFIAALPLVDYVIPVFGLFTNVHRTATAEPLAKFVEVIVRALLLLPAAWFVRFAAVRHAALFKLREHYVYKYSVASSVEGFKKQAEPYKDEIAAATFFELTFNPATRMDDKVQEARHPNPAMEWVMQKITGKK
jgi:hypothetical protein